MIPDHFPDIISYGKPPHCPCPLVHTRSCTKRIINPNVYKSTVQWIYFGILTLFLVTNHFFVSHEYKWIKRRSIKDRVCFTVCQRRRRAVMKEKSFVKSVTAKHVQFPPSWLAFCLVVPCLVFSKDFLLPMTSYGPVLGIFLCELRNAWLMTIVGSQMQLYWLLLASWFNGSLASDTEPISELPKKNTNRFKCICRQVLLLFSCCNNNKIILVDFAIRTRPLLSCKTPLSPAGGPFNIIMDSSTLRFIFASVRQSLNPKTSVKRHILQMHKNCTNTVERCA